MTTYIIHVLLTFLMSSSTLALPRRNIRAASEYRLPQDVAIPENYNLQIFIDPDSFTDGEFAGILDIKLKVLQKTWEIKLNSHWTMELTKITLRSEAKNETILLQKSNFTMDNDTEILTIVTVTPLTADTTYFLHFEYTAKLFRTKNGFFLFDYETEKGNFETIAITKFKPTYARQAFPCFDEPMFKATFDIQIEHPSKYNAIGNTEGNTERTVSNHTDDDEDLVVTTFEQTAVMSTYLVAIVLSDFTCDTAPKIKMPYSLCSRSNTAHTRRYGLEIGPKLVHVLETFINISFVDKHMSKLCQVAIPDLSENYAQNWGLSIFNEKSLLYDETKSSRLDQQHIGTKIAHEITHRWFGSLVTACWWSDAFLNEGLTSYAEYFAARRVLSGWELDKQYPLDMIQPMLRTDSTQAAQPLFLEVSTPQEIKHRHGALSFKKGGALIYMVETVLPPETFQHGIRKYLNDNQFGCVTSEDLWNAFGNSTPMPEGETLSSVMENWIKRPGYPVVTVSLNGNHIIFSQKRFLTDGSRAKKNEKWFIPLTWATPVSKSDFNDTLPKGWLTPERDFAVENFLGKSEENWIVLNVRSAGYYRVMYDKELQSRIDKALFKNNFDGILDLNRALMVDDYFYLVLAGLRTFDDFFKFLKFVTVDESYYTWDSTFTVLSIMSERISKKEISEKFAKFILKLMDAFYKSVYAEIKDDDHIFTLRKMVAFERACHYGHESCIRMAKDNLKKYIHNNRKPNRNLKSIVYCYGLRYTDHPTTEWNKLWEEYQNTKSLREKHLILSSLACVKDEELLEGYLTKAINIHSGIRPYDSATVFSEVSNHRPENVDICLKFLMKNFKSIYTFYNHDYNKFRHIFAVQIERFTNKKQVKRFEDFVTENNKTLPEHFHKDAKAAIKSAKKNLKLTKLFEKALSTYFETAESLAERGDVGDDVNSALHMKISLTAVITILIIFLQRFLF